VAEATLVAQVLTLEEMVDQEFVLFAINLVVKQEQGAQLLLVVAITTTHLQVQAHLQPNGTLCKNRK
jgi:hypothetical protein